MSSEYVERAISLVTMGSHCLLDVEGSAAEAWLAVPEPSAEPAKVPLDFVFGMIEFVEDV